VLPNHVFFIFFYFKQFCQHIFLVRFLVLLVDFIIDTITYINSLISLTYMKILAFSDLHVDMDVLRRLKKKAIIEKVDYIIAAGDLSMFENGFDIVLYELNELNIPILLIHGNHESRQFAEAESKNFKNIIFMHKKSIVKENVLFLGYGGGGFSTSDKELDKYSDIFKKEIMKNKGKKIVFIIHGPPYKMLDGIYGNNVGCKSRAKFINDVKPDIVICGHLHEFAGKFLKVGKTLVINPGWEGKVFQI